MFAKRLHIPLHTKKTVRRKRTVSLYLFFFLGGLFSLWFCARAWMINRSLTLTFIPEGTSAVILLSPTQETWPKILEDFGDIPLLSHRSLTLSDIAPYLEGPFSFFFLKNGETAIGFKTHPSLPISLFHEYGISSQPYPEKDQTFTLLSKGTQKMITLEHDQKPFFLTPKIGTLTFFEKNTPSFVGTIRLDPKGYRLQTPSSSPATLPKISWPETIIGAIQFSSSPKTILLPLFSFLSSFSESFGSLSSGTILFAQNNNSLETLLSLKQEDLQDISTVLRLFGAIQNPILKKQQLPDKTPITEKRIDPSEVSLEEIVLTGIPVLRTKTSSGTLFGVQTEQTILFATGERILSFWLHKDEKEKIPFDCGNNSLGFLKPHASFFFLFTGQQNKQSSPLWSLLSKFALISLNKEKKTDDILFCY